MFANILALVAALIQGSPNVAGQLNASQLAYVALTFLAAHSAGLAALGPKWALVGTAVGAVASALLSAYFHGSGKPAPKK